MSCVGKLRAFFNKDNFDYSHGNVNPYEFHTIFYSLAKIFRVIDNEPIPKWTIIVPIFICSCGVVAAMLFCICMIHNVYIFDIPMITESGSYFILMIYKLLMLSCTLTHKPHYHRFLQAIRDDFAYICTTGYKYRERFFENQLRTWKATVFTLGFLGVIGGGVLVCAKIALLIVLIYRPEGADRPLPFPFWYYDVDFGKTPTYEFFFVFSDMCVLSHCSVYVFMIHTQIVWSRQIMCKADVIIWTIDDLLVDVQPTDDVQQIEYYRQIIKNRMTNIIKMHHSMYSLLDDYASVHIKVLIFEQKTAAPMVCLTAFCGVQKLEAGELPGIMMLLFTSLITFYFIPNYMCTILAEKVQSIRDACWNTSFWNAPGQVIRPYFINIMQRSLRRLPIHASGFEDVSLETFADKMTVAYSGFNMLRQANYEI